jgi:hypothetical protein
MRQLEAAAEADRIDRCHNLWCPVAKEPCKNVECAFFIHAASGETRDEDGKQDFEVISQPGCRFTGGI